MKTNTLIIVTWIIITVAVYLVGYKLGYIKAQSHQESPTLESPNAENSELANPWTDEMLAQAMPIEYCSEDAIAELSGLSYEDIVYLYRVADAVAVKETNNNADSIGAAGEIGALQILGGAIIDVNQEFGTNYHIQEMTDTLKAKEVFALYLTRWGKEHIQTRDSKSIARIWNGGPTGPSKRCTAQYGNDVLAIMEAICQN
jgi:hypothetical protein